MELPEGSTFDSFLAEEGVFGDVAASAAAGIVAQAVAHRMDTDRISHEEAARQAGIEPAELNSLLAFRDDEAASRLSLATLVQAAAYGGLRLSFERAEPMRFDGPHRASGDDTSLLRLSPTNRERLDASVASLGDGEG